MVNFVQEGETLQVTAPYTLTSGLGCQVGQIFGVATDDFANGATGAQVKVSGVFDLAKATGAIVAGEILYWDNTAKVVTTTASGNKRVGIATQAQASGDATARISLSRAPQPRWFKSAEQTGTGSAQNIAHGMGITPAYIIVYPSDLAAAVTGVYTLTEGAHTATNVVVTVTSGKKFFVFASA